MRILSITAQKPHSTGSGTYLTELVREFDRMGHEQAVVCGIYSDDKTAFPDRVMCYPVIFDCGEKHSPDFPIAGMSDVMPYPSTRYRDMTEDMLNKFEDAFTYVIGKAVDEFHPDLIICHHLFLLTAIVRRDYPDLAVYGICHGSDLRQFMSCSHLQDFIRPEIAKLDRIFALHDLQRDKITTLYGSIVSEKITVTGSGYNSDIFNPDRRTPRSDDDPVRLVYAGKMSEAKGVPELLDVLEELSREGVDFTATLAGGCQDKAIMRKLEKLPSNIKVVGQVPQDKLASIFKDGDIFILPSYFEGLGLVLIEAMACGMLPISTDIPGVREWIDANVGNSIVRYIPMPEMLGVDIPTESGREQFKKDMKAILISSIYDISNGSTQSLPSPDTSRITWNAVCNSIL
ncbi:MAG: glycosyltransferase family 4 protein [Clostridiales bacterium]|nr:glycosyltransferase family 4 protein [Candidatus Crickella caballi]